ncbi:uncharacterized protein PG998_013746 [Apiospora kogelbergensis]|uniref:uncharacterized protein n=1 Tax=Apiospora kogelbergensis TaxID=1337665 RepID=UPI00312EEF39
MSYNNPYSNAPAAEQGYGYDGQQQVSQAQNTTFLFTTANMARQCVGSLYSSDDAKEKWHGSPEDSS